jgi:catechol 2,3-dioxygenase-like lactoylglutathione lyase family enzyme
MSGSDDPKATVNVFECVNPIFPVENLKASLDYYVGILGFKVDWQEPAIMASVSRGRGCIMLCEGDQGHPGTWVWIGVEDAAALYQEYSAKGARVRNPPTNYPWAYEMQVEDPDGNVLRLGSEPKEGQSFGPWLDMRGVRWAKSPTGGWTRVEHD